MKELLKNKVAIVTGGGRGIGRGHSLHLAKSGANVLVNDIDSEEAEKVVNEILLKPAILYSYHHQTMRYRESHNRRYL